MFGFAVHAFSLRISAGLGGTAGFNGSGGIVNEINQTVACVLAVLFQCSVLLGLDDNDATGGYSTVAMVQ